MREYSEIFLTSWTCHKNRLELIDQTVLIRGNSFSFRSNAASLRKKSSEELAGATETNSLDLIQSVSPRNLVKNLHKFRGHECLRRVSPASWLKKPRSQQRSQPQATRKEEKRKEKKKEKNYVENNRKTELELKRVGAEFSDCVVVYFYYCLSRELQITRW